MSRPQTRPPNLVDLLFQHAASHGSEMAFRFLTDGESEEAYLTYAQLAGQAQIVAASLQQAGCTGERAVLVYQPGLDYIVGFLGCLLAGVTAVPAYPPDPFRMERTFPRFQAIVNDSRPAALLSTASILELAGDILDGFREFAGVTRIATDALPAEAADDWRMPTISGDTLACLQYTSGSTAAPKGVMLTHSNLIANLELIHDGFGLTDQTVGVIWLPPYHDMGLIGGILEQLYKGRGCTLLSPLDFLQRPMRWLNAITKYRATVSGGPNFAYDLAARKATPQQKAALDLSTWEVAFNGAEPVRKETIERFSATFAECGFRKEAFYSCYGLAEATLIVSGGAVLTPPVYKTISASKLGEGRVVASEEGVPDTQTLVGCGNALADHVIAIVDPETLRPSAPHEVGEVWVSGDSVAQGYWQKPQESEGAFRAELGDGRFYLRTGDLGFLDAEGNLFIAGRIKDLIIIDGRNHYPQDIELTVEKCHPAIRPGCTAAFPITESGQECLVVVAEIGKGYKASTGSDRTHAGSDTPAPIPAELDGAEVVAAIRRAIAKNHDLRVHAIMLLEAGAIPKTSSGKIQRHASRSAYLANALETWGTR